MSKRKYSRPTADLVIFDNEDVITASILSNFNPNMNYTSTTKNGTIHFGYESNTNRWGKREWSDGGWGEWQSSSEDEFNTYREANQEKVCFLGIGF